MKILLVSDARGAHEYLYRGLIALGHDCEMAVLFYDPIGNVEHAKVFFPWRRWGRIGRILRPYQIYWRTKFLPKYDVMSFVHRVSIYADGDAGQYSDIPRLAKKAKLLSYTALGCDEIGLIKNNPVLPYSPCESCERLDETGQHCINVVRSLHKQGIFYLRKYFNVVISTMVEYDHSRNLFDGPTARLPLPLDIAEIPWKPAQHLRRKLKIIHSPSRGGFKGSEVVMKAIDILKSRRSDFEFEIVAGLPFQEYVRVMEDTDIVIDQVWSQSAGMNALWMLGMGKVVFSGNSELCKSYFPFGSENPIIDAEPDAYKLADRLGDILANREQIPDMVARGRKYIETHHNHITVAQCYVDLWQQVIQSKTNTSASLDLGGRIL